MKEIANHIAVWLKWALPTSFWGGLAYFAIIKGVPGPGHVLGFFLPAAAVFFAVFTVAVLIMIDNKAVPLSVVRYLTRQQVPFEVEAVVNACIVGVFAWTINYGWAAMYLSIAFLQLSHRALGQGMAVKQALARFEGRS
jgi:hypothetical protein